MRANARALRALTQCFDENGSLKEVLDHTGRFVQDYAHLATVALEVVTDLSQTSGHVKFRAKRTLHEFLHIFDDSLITQIGLPLGWSRTQADQIKELASSALAALGN